MIDEPCTCKHGNLPCIRCTPLRGCLKSKNLSERWPNTLTTSSKICWTSTDDHMLPPPDKSRLSDPPNGATSDPLVNSCDFYDSRTALLPDKSANPMQPLILSEPSTSALGEVQKPSVSKTLENVGMRIMKHFLSRLLPHFPLFFSYDC